MHLLAEPQAQMLDACARYMRSVHHTADLVNLGRDRRSREKALEFFLYFWMLLGG